MLCVIVFANPAFGLQDSVNDVMMVLYLQLKGLGASCSYTHIPLSLSIELRSNFNTGTVIV